MEPEVAHVGLTEAEAREKYGEVNVSRVNTGSMDRFITESETIGFVKLVMDKNDVLLGRVTGLSCTATQLTDFRTGC